MNKWFTEKALKFMKKNDHLTQSMQIRTTWENILPTRLENIKKFDEHVVTLRT